MKPVFKPADFKPQIWETLHDGQKFLFLVCGNRFVSSPASKNSAGGWVCDRFTHPVAILCTAPAIVLYGFTDDCHEWKVALPHEHGIGDSAARAALAEAWRGVESIASATWPATIHRFHFKSNLALANDDLAKPQEKTMLRNITAWLQWSRWAKRELTMEQRAKTLSDMGLPTTGRAIERAAAEVGL